MGLKASAVTLSKGLESILLVAVQQKGYLVKVNNDLAANIDANYGLDFLQNLDRIIPMLDAFVALPGMVDYAVAQMGSNVVADYTAMRSALDAIRVWLRTNIPANAISVVNGVRTPAVFAPATTTQLRALVQAAIATID